MMEDIIKGLTGGKKKYQLNGAQMSSINAVIREGTEEKKVRGMIGHLLGFGDMKDRTKEQKYIVTQQYKRVAQNISPPRQTRARRKKNNSQFNVRDQRPKMRVDLTRMTTGRKRGAEKRKKGMPHKSIISPSSMFAFGSKIPQKITKTAEQLKQNRDRRKSIAPNLGVISPIPLPKDFEPRKRTTKTTTPITPTSRRKRRNALLSSDYQQGLTDAIDTIVSSAKDERKSESDITHLESDKISRKLFNQKLERVLDRKLSKAVELAEQQRTQRTKPRLPSHDPPPLPHPPSRPALPKQPPPRLHPPKRESPIVADFFPTTATTKRKMGRTSKAKKRARRARQQAQAYEDRQQQRQGKRQFTQGVTRTTTTTSTTTTSAWSPYRQSRQYGAQETKEGQRSYGKKEKRKFRRNLDRNHPAYLKSMVDNHNYRRVKYNYPPDPDPSGPYGPQSRDGFTNPISVQAGAQTDPIKETQELEEQEKFEAPNSLRPKFMLGGAENVKQTKEQEIINELAFNSFDYVMPNGYLGENKIWNYKDNNASIRYKSPLGLPRSFEPNHGVVPLPSKFSSHYDMNTAKSFINDEESRKNKWNNLMSQPKQTSSILPGDLNSQSASHCLRYWCKKTPLHFEIDTSFKMNNAFDPAGNVLGKRGFKSVYDTQWNPMKVGEVFPMSKNVPDYNRYRLRNHMNIAY